jgi:GNAT superfamily N-acetyltransferase
MNVLVMNKHLRAEPLPRPIEGITVAALRLPDDAADWLALRQRSFADEAPPVRDWTIQDFVRELYCTNRESRRTTWLARPANVAGADPCGAVSLSRPIKAMPVARIHWLMVDPAWRRQGVGTWLISTAERYCWELGWPDLRLETHRNWTAAVQFYRVHGYQ